MKILNVLYSIYHSLYGNSLSMMKRRGLTVGEHFFLGDSFLDMEFLAFNYHR